VKWAQWGKTQSRELLVCSYVCASHCAQLLHTILHRTDLIVFPLPSRQSPLLGWCLFEGRGGGRVAQTVLLGHSCQVTGTCTIATRGNDWKLWPAHVWDCNCYHGLHIQTLSQGLAAENGTMTAMLLPSQVQCIFHLQCAYHKTDVVLALIKFAAKFIHMLYDEERVRQWSVF